MSPYLRISVQASLLMVMILVPCVLAAQQGRQVRRSPNELLSAFEKEYQTPKGPISGVGRDIVQVITYPESYAPRDLDAFVEGLTKIALKGTTSRVRQSAAINLSFLGSGRKSHPVGAMVDRLQRIYKQTGDPVVRSTIVVGLSDVAERPRALTILKKIAVQQRQKADFPGSASRALGSLVAMDEEGRAVLRQLYESGAVSDPDARLELENLAKQNFRMP